MPSYPRPSRTGIDRRTLIGGGAIMLAGAGMGGLVLARGNERVVGSALERGYDQLCADLADAWWDPGSNTSAALPGIRSTDGSGGSNTGRANFNDHPASIANARGGAFWEAAQYLRFLSNDRALRYGASANDFRKKQTSDHIAAQRRLWHSIYSPEELSSDGSRDGTVNASDDAAWKLQALKAIHHATGAPADLAILRAATVAILSHYADTITPAHRRTVDGLSFSAYGCVYARPEQDRNGQGRATTYEAGIMDVALYLARSGSQNAAFRTYAATVYANFKATLQRPSGIYFQTLQLDPAGTHDATPFLTPIDANKPVPRQDIDGVTIGGTMGMAVVAAELFRQTGDDRYRRDVAHIVAGITAEYLQHGRVLCDRDPWTAGVWGYDFADRSLALVGVDPGGKMVAAINATAAHILSTRTSIDAYTGRPAWGYSAEWSGNTERSIGESRTGANDGRILWEANALAANAGRGGGQASANQIMTATSSGGIVQAAVRLGGRRVA